MKKLLLIFACMLLTTGCGVRGTERDTTSEEIPYVQESGQPEKTVRSYLPLNYTNQIGLWLPYMGFADYMQGKTEEEYRSEVKKRLGSAAEQGINTVYFHVHPNGDSYYKSDIFPRGIYWDGDYDPLEIMLEEAHALGISVHAWLNPLRMQTIEQMKAAPGDFIVRQWTEDPQNTNVKIVGDRWYLVPASDEVRSLISSAADEILNRYDVDGIHIDDYFYPTTDTEFDREAFEASGSNDLAEWRRENVTRFVKGLYDTVKKRGSRFKFGISPQGNIDTDLNRQYADVKLWAGTKGYADYIVPQIYYGFKNETQPFEPTLRQWEELVGDSGVSLIIGLAGYKVGKSDKWAGAGGENEWIESPDVIQRQIDLTNRSTADGYALYY